MTTLDPKASRKGLGWRRWGATRVLALGVAALGSACNADTAVDPADGDGHAQDVPGEDVTTRVDTEPASDDASDASTSATEVASVATDVDADLPPDTGGCVPKIGVTNDATCDGIDDDCDGTTDEDYAHPAIACDKGTCIMNGTNVCTDGQVVPECSGPCLPKVTIWVDDLGVPDVTDACFDVRIADETGKVILARGDPTHATQTGEVDLDDDADLGAAVARGSLCGDADDHASGRAMLLETALPTGSYTVTFWVHNLYGVAGELGDSAWRNPCPPPNPDALTSDPNGGCNFTFVNDSSGWSRMEVELSILQDTSLGFFDAGIAFQHIVCSATVATCAGPGDKLGFATGEPIASLRDTDDQPLRTAVVSFACLALDPTQIVELLADDLYVSCSEDGSADAQWQPITDQVRLIEALDIGTQLNHGATNLLNQWALDRGTESVPCGVGLTCTKAHWTTAIAIRADGPSDVAGADRGRRNCRITGHFSATTNPLTFGDSEEVGYVLSGFSVYPFVELSVEVTDSNAAWECRSATIPLVGPIGPDGEPTGGDAIEARYPGNAFCNRFGPAGTRRSNGFLCPWPGD